MSDDDPPYTGPDRDSTPAANHGWADPPGGAPTSPNSADTARPASEPKTDDGAPTRLEPVDLYEAAKRAPGSVDIEKQREDVREYLAKRLLLLLAGTMVLGAALMVSRRWTKLSDEDIRLFFQVGFTAVIALVSAATGFYFGNAANNRNGTGGNDS